MLAIIERDSVHLRNRQAAERTEQYPELQRLTGLVPAGTVLDGEIVVLQQGKPSFHSVIKRDLARQPAAIAHRRRSLPVTYAVFDILYHSGDDVRRRSLSQRQVLLEELNLDGVDGLHVVQNFPSGIRLFEAVRDQGLEGIVAKRLDSSYIPGKKSDAWRKVKHLRHALCAVGGYTARQGIPSGLLLGLYDENDLVYVGSVGSGLTQADWQDLLPFLKQAETAASPFTVPPVIRQREVHWVHPILGVDVSFMEWSAGMRLRSPVLKGFGLASTEECSFRVQGV